MGRSICRSDRRCNILASLPLGTPSLARIHTRSVHRAAVRSWGLASFPGFAYGGRAAEIATDRDRVILRSGGGEGERERASKRERERDTGRRTPNGAAAAAPNWTVESVEMERSSMTGRNCSSDRTKAALQWMTHPRPIPRTPFTAIP